MKDMNRAQARLSRTTEIFDRIFNEYGTSRVNPLVGKDVTH